MSEDKEYTVSGDKKYTVSGKFEGDKIKCNKCGYIPKWNINHFMGFCEKCLINYLDHVGIGRMQKHDD